MWPIRLSNLMESGLEFKANYQVKFSYKDWQFGNYQWLQNKRKTLKNVNLGHFECIQGPPPGHLGFSTSWKVTWNSIHALSENVVQQLAV